MDVRLPQYSEFQQAVHGGTFADPALRGARPRRTPMGQPSVATGGFAVTFDVTAGGDRFAVRCFHKHRKGLPERYAAVDDFVRQHRGSLDFLTAVEYVAEGIRVNGNVFPIVRMPWINGEQLDTWVDNHLLEPHRIDRIRDQITTAAARLRVAGAAHGDLQHGNILVDKADQVRLVDYDGMFVPALKRLGASEYGHRNYQHPDRGDTYDNQLDAFAAYVIDLSLDALKHDPSLWKEFNTGENLIFEAKDFAAPSRSEIFTRVARIAPLADRARLLADACAASFAAVPAILAGERTSGSSVRAPAASRRPTGPDVVDAHDREALMARVGDEVTIVGRVTDSYTDDGPKTKTTFINFGNWRRGAFRIVAWSGISHQIEVEYGKNGEDLRGKWVKLSGLVTQFQPNRSNASCPQIELKRVQALRKLEEADVRAMLAPPRQPDAPPAPRPEPEPAHETSEPASGSYRWSAPPKSQPSSGTYRWSAPPNSQPNPTVNDHTRRIDQRIDRWASSRNPTRPASSPPPAPPPPQAPTPPPPPQQWPPSSPPPVWPPYIPARTSMRQRLRKWLRH